LATRPGKNTFCSNGFLLELTGMVAEPLAVQVALALAPSRAAIGVGCVSHAFHVVVAMLRAPPYGLVLGLKEAGTIRH